jgi:hypothetical protein
MEAAWGTWADWATVVAGVAGTVAVAILARKANAIAAATRAETARTIAAQAAEREREARLLLNYIAQEFVGAANTAAAMMSIITQFEMRTLTPTAQRIEMLRTALRVVSFKKTQSVFGRLHALDDATCDAAARCIAVPDLVLSALALVQVGRDEPTLPESGYELIIRPQWLRAIKCIEQLQEDANIVVAAAQEVGGGWASMH